MYRDRRIWSQSGSFRATVLILAAWLSTLLPVTAAETLRGVALVIGNSAYEHLPQLANPDSDARAIEDLFEDLGFEVSNARDADARKLRRAIERFVEDSEGADVAVVYYAGHGIEAGGENYLVPVDADIAALDDAGQKLVPLTALIDNLRAAVPMTIVLLDACRDNPFPSGAMARATPDAAPAPLSAGGLAETRGVTRFGGKIPTEAPGTETLGTLIGFAAEPGKRALDGEPGGNSPYASAVLRHLSAITGEEFGTVMRMVAEEVYLKTSGTQRPWVSESLRRLLYFGPAPDPLPGEQGEILTERRQLLLTIAALPDPERRQIERVASKDGVPMDALYGMLRALGKDAPKDLVELEKLLGEQATRIKDLLGHRELLENADAELTRLSRLAEEALAEGALMTSIRIQTAAKKRVEALRSTVENTERAVERKRREFSIVFAQSGEMLALAGRYGEAADDLEKAANEIVRWDPRKAWDHRNREIVLLVDGFQTQREIKFLDRGILLARGSIADAITIGDAGREGRAYNHLGVLQGLKAQQLNDLQFARLALEAYRGAHTLISAKDGLLWSSHLKSMASTQLQIGRLTDDRNLVEEAAATLRLALKAREADVVPFEKVNVTNNLAVALTELGMIAQTEQPFDEAIQLQRSSLTTFSRTRFPELWFEAQDTLAVALARRGRIHNDRVSLEEAIILQQELMASPMIQDTWLTLAKAENQLAVSLIDLSTLDSGSETIIKAINLYQGAIRRIDADLESNFGYILEHNIGFAKFKLAQRKLDYSAVREAIEHFRRALRGRTRSQSPTAWTDTQSQLANALAFLGFGEADATLLRSAVSAYNEVLEITKSRPLVWADTKADMGAVRYQLAYTLNDSAEYDRSVADLEAAVSIRTKAKWPYLWAKSQIFIALALKEQGVLTHRKDRLSEASKRLTAARDTLISHPQYRSFASIIETLMTEIAEMR